MDAVAIHFDEHTILGSRGEGTDQSESQRHQGNISRHGSSPIKSDGSGHNPFARAEVRFCETHFHLTGNACYTP